jgi:hypothetical protein
MPRGWTWGPAQPKNIPATVQASTRKRIEEHAAKNFAGRYARLDIRFRGRFCYVDAFKEPDVKHDAPPSWFEGTAEQWWQQMRDTPLHLIRLTYTGDVEKWELAFFTYSNEKYSECVFPDGQFEGVPEQGFDIGATYL